MLSWFLFWPLLPGDPLPWQPHVFFTCNLVIFDTLIFVDFANCDIRIFIDFVTFYIQFYWQHNENKWKKNFFIKYKIFAKRKICKISWFRAFSCIFLNEIANDWDVFGKSELYDQIMQPFIVRSDMQKLPEYAIIDKQKRIFNKNNLLKSLIC